MKISVCMATFNGEKFLKQQLDSILKQLGVLDELIISDDGSTDETIAIIKSFDDQRIRFFESTHKNLIFNFENALKQAQGDFIFLCDQDDIWFDHKVATCVAHLKKYELVFSNAAMFQGTDIINTELFFKDSKKKTGTISNLIKVKFLGATLAFRKTVLNRALPFPKNIPMHDVWIGLIAETTATTHYIDEPLIYYRRHENTASTAGGKSKNSLYTMLKIRWVLMVNLCSRVWFGKKINK